MTGYRSKILTALVLALIIVAYAATISAAAVAVGQKAPDFKLHSVSGSSDIKLTDFSDKPTLLVFYVSWCPHCRSEIPSIQKLYLELAPKGLNVVGVDLDQTIGDAQSFANTYKITFPNAHGNPDTAKSTLDAYGVSGVPMVIVLDKGGVVKAVHRGEVSEATLRSELGNVGVK